MGLFGVFWAVLLAGYAGDYVEAGRTARTIQGELLRAPMGSPTFLTRYPYFLYSEARVPVAQVYHDGLWDWCPPAVRPRRGAGLSPASPRRSRAAAGALGAPASRV